MAERSLLARRPAPNNPFSSSLKDGILRPSPVCASKRPKKGILSLIRSRNDSLVQLDNCCCFFFNYYYAWDNKVIGPLGQLTAVTI